MEPGLFKEFRQEFTREVNCRRIERTRPRSVAAGIGTD
jgi:hypothetical protein